MLAGAAGCSPSTTYFFFRFPLLSTHFLPFLPLPPLRFFSLRARPLMPPLRLFVKSLPPFVTSWGCGYASRDRADRPSYPAAAAASQGSLSQLTQHQASKSAVGVRARVSCGDRCPFAAGVSLGPSARSSHIHPGVPSPSSPAFPE